MKRMGSLLLLALCSSFTWAQTGAAPVPSAPAAAAVAAPAAATATAPPAVPAPAVSTASPLSPAALTAGAAAQADAAPPPGMNAWQRREYLLGLLRSAQFAVLDAELNHRYQAFQSGAERESDIGLDLRVMRGAGAEELARFDAWIKQMPESGIALLARATFAMNKGWQARGTGYAGRTAPGRVDEMNRLHDVAMADYSAAFAKLPRCAMCLSGLINIAKTRGLRDEAGRWFAQAIKINPNALYAVVNQAYLLDTRWGGAAGERDAFIEQMQRLHPNNPGLAWLKAEPLRERARQARDARQFDRAIALYDQAFALYPEHQSLMGKSYSLAEQKRYPEALQAITLALDHEADEMSLFERRGWLLQQLNRHAEAETDLTIAIGMGSQWAFQALTRAYFGNGAKGAPQDQAKAHALCEQGALQGIPEAFWCMGGLFYFGQNGVAKDAAKAAQWFERAVAKNVAGAKVDLGLMLWNGEGVTVDQPRAIALWREAMAQGEPRAAAKLESHLSAWQSFRHVTLPRIGEAVAGFFAGLFAAIGNAIAGWFSHM